MPSYLGETAYFICDDPIAGEWHHPAPEEVDNIVEGEITGDNGAGMLLATVTYTYEVGEAERTETVTIGVAEAYFEE